MKKSVEDQVQGGIDARVDQPQISSEVSAKFDEAQEAIRQRTAAVVGPMLSNAYRSMLGWDGTSLDDAVEQAYTATGPPREELRKRIEFRRAHPDRCYSTKSAA